MKFPRIAALSLAGLVSTIWPAASQAAESATAVAASRAPDLGVSALWVLANVSHAGMRAQGSDSWVWRIVAFVAGFPGTLLTWLFVKEGGERAYGIDLPRRRDADTQA